MAPSESRKQTNRDRKQWSRLKRSIGVRRWLGLSGCVVCIEEGMT